MAQLREKTTSVVLVGAFNPAIVQPAWLAHHGLVSQELADAAVVNLIHRQASEFQVGDFKVQTLDQRMSVTSATAPDVDQIRDLAIGIMQILPETPIRLVGLNQNSFYSLAGEDVWNGLGWRIAPRENWDAVMTSPGLRAIVVEDTRPDDHAGYIRVKVSPSERFAPNAIEIDVNDHYQLAGGDAATRGAEASELIDNQWSESQERAARFVQHVTGLAP